MTGTLSEYGDIGVVYAWLLTDQEAAEKMQRELWSVYNHPYGGGDFSECLKDMIPYVFRIFSHLVADCDDFVALARRMPDILKSLPYESSGHLDGTDYDFATTKLQQRAMQAKTAAEFVAGSSKKPVVTAVETVEASSQADLTAWQSGFAAEIEELEQLGLYLADESGNDLSGKILQRYSHKLLSVAHQRPDLQHLVAVLRDAADWHKMSGDYKWPVRVLEQAVEAMPDPATQLKQLFPEDSVPVKILAGSPSLCLRLLAMPDSGLLRRVRIQLPVLAPLLSSERAVAAFVDLLVLMNFNRKIYFDIFLSALPQIAAAARHSDSVTTLVLARELLLAGQYLRDVTDWLPAICEVAGAVPGNDPAMLADAARLMPCGELVRHCMPMLEHGVSWSELCENLWQMWQRLRKDYTYDHQARRAVAEIFAREAPRVTSAADFAVFCGMFPDALSPLSMPRGRFFKPRFQSDPPETMPGSDPVPPDMSVRLLGSYPKEVEKNGFRHVCVWWNGRTGAFEFPELYSAMSGSIRTIPYTVSGHDAWALLGLAREKFPPEGNEASLQLTARTLGLTLAQLQDLLEKSRACVFPEKGQYDDR